MFLWISAQALFPFFPSVLPSAHAGPFMIAIGGGSRSGKTTHATALTQKIRAELGTADFLSQDNYFNPKEQPTSFHKEYSYKDVVGMNWNFDHPTAMDWETMRADLADIRSGKTVSPPVYHFGTGGVRELNAGPAIERPDFLIFEGIHALNDNIKEQFDLRIFVDAQENVIYERLLAAGAGRQQSKQDTDSYYPILREGFNDYIYPSRRNADLTVSGERGLESNLSQIVQKIRSMKESFESTESRHPGRLAAQH